MKPLRILSLLLALCAAPALAQQPYPNRPVKLVVGNAPGGATDVVARLYAEELAKVLKQPFVVENKPGAGSLLGALAAKNAPADGYTLYFGSTLNFTSTFVKTNSIDAAKEFVPVAKVAQGDLFVYARGDLGVNNIKELAAKAKAGTLHHSSPSPTQYLLAAQISKAAGFQFDNVPYRSTDQALLALLSGNGAFMVNSLPGMPEHVRSGKLKILATVGAERSTLMPDVPTLKEQGVNMEMDFFLGIWAPQGTPRDVVNKLNAAVHEASKSPALREKVTSLAMVAKPTTPEDLLRSHEVSTKAYQEAAALVGFKPD